jgi:hypothetical protein
MITPFEFLLWAGSWAAGGGSPPLHCFDDSVRAAIRRPQHEKRKV